MKEDRGIPEYHAVSLSGGKDSTALLLMMIEKGMPIDVVVCADPGMEFPEMYEHLAKVDELLFRERGLHVQYLRHPNGFEWMMFEKPIGEGDSADYREKRGIPLRGKGWPNSQTRWCTGYLKTYLIQKFVNRLKEKKNAKHYVGIASDEAWRCKGEVYPLVEWGITEAQALQYCYNRGFDWGGLYEIYHRCSCWCCPLQPIDGLRKLRKHHPELWERLRDLDARAREQFGDSPLGRFKDGYSVEMLEERFTNEDAQCRLCGW